MLTALNELETHWCRQITNVKLSDYAFQPLSFNPVAAQWGGSRDYPSFGSLIGWDAETLGFRRPTRLVISELGSSTGSVISVLSGCTVYINSRVCWHKTGLQYNCLVNSRCNGIPLSYLSVGRERDLLCARAGRAWELHSNCQERKARAMQAEQSILRIWDALHPAEAGSWSVACVDIPLGVCMYHRHCQDWAKNPC